LAGEQICLESRILAVIDMYEALIAQDRPYKRRIPPEKAVEILREEVAANHLDKEVVDFFVEKAIYRVFIGD
jgi:HD-GYP domain-containing protein (c-di-GMP phosphodiesterase class II)